MIRQAAHIVVALDDGTRPLGRRGLDDVGVQRALGQEIHMRNLFGFLIENLNEGMADDLTLLLRIIHTLQAGKETFGSVHDSKIEIQVVTEKMADLLDFVLTQQAVVHEDAVQVLAYGPVQEHSHDSGIDAAGKSADDLTVANLGGHFLHHAIDKGRHGPVRHRKLLIMVVPRTVWCTSGWNCTA